MVAKQNGWKGESKAVATACEAYLEHDIGEKFGIRLAAQMTEAIKKEMQGHNNRCANLALKAFYAAEQARILNIHALQFILGVTEDVDQLPLILEASQKEAWKNLKRHIGDDATDR